MSPPNDQHDGKIFANHGDEFLLLSHGELTALTGTKQPARQRQWLDARGWPFVEASGRSSYPRVARFIFEEQMRCRETNFHRPQPRYDALDRLAKST